jgi:nitroreductase
MKQNKIVCVLFCLGVSVLCAADDSIFTGHFAASNFTTGEISGVELDAVLNAGIRAPSSNNRQPWHFTVVRTADLTRRIIPACVNGNIVIVVSAPENGVKNGWDQLDCGLALESMYLAAQNIGLGSRIYTGPHRDNANNLKRELALPEGHVVVATLRIGKIQNSIDATSSASYRQPLNAKVTYK